MHPLIERLDRALREQRPRSYADLRPGASQKEIAALRACAGMPLPELLIELLQWRNGQQRCTLHYNQSLMSADHIIQTTEMMRVLGDGEFDHKDWWCHNWIPFLHNGGSDHLCVDLDGAFADEGGIPGQIIDFCHDAEFRDILYPSFSAWLEMLIVSTERGMWSDEDGQPESWKASKVYLDSLSSGYPKPVRLDIPYD
ncbi:SMI1/KNR4 family protein [Mycobacteroides abscessus]|uniref:SMI1/KNR4 family protein n=1 Tax=Mycobacteroides abscessus TaxID=36809 RepID=UPI000C25E5E4|nr:SMI1/KNR4 family protein [Mycobacteroides abscessus]RIR12430.1 SMI1/KNR4 family protein [Mycobacteroides abscessus]RIR61504.1 SMI1/KNR4 family protein [Mycobacteroides abscessus]RIR71830.1 SMI1/KNR4 family protein [Mycobacteroides abscessus]RIR97270.1 SMI1/KNR4 family protein [Mycobacteroides abscessus]RIS36204.1 SMI1/KNR4 family protein [Mycobacteroides abscessus]